MVDYYCRLYYCRLIVGYCRLSDLYILFSEICRKYDIIVLSDEIYAQCSFNGHRNISMAKVI